MAKPYSVEKVTTEIYVATCNICSKPFSSDVEAKAISKVTDHIRDAHGK